MAKGLQGRLLHWDCLERVAVRKVVHEQCKTKTNIISRCKKIPCFFTFTIFLFFELLVLFLVLKSWVWVYSDLKWLRWLSKLVFFLKITQSESHESLWNQTSNRVVSAIGYSLFLMHFIFTSRWIKSCEVCYEFTNTSPSLSLWIHTHIYIYTYI